jgi:hypothetical protein
MTTITAAEIISHWVAVIEAAMPLSLSGRPYRRLRAPAGELRRWALQAGGNDILRLFEIRRNGPRVDPGLQWPTASYVNQPFLLTLAYAAQPKLYDLDDIAELEDLIAEDAQQLRDLIFGGTGLAGDGHNASVVEYGAPDRADPRGVWFMDLTITAKFFTGQEL